MDFSDVMNRLNTEDRFSAVNDMKLVTVNEGFAEAELAVSDNSMNSLNVIQGGAIYTLADFAFSGAANANRERRRFIGSAASINYIRPGTGSKLKAVARTVHAGRRTCVCTVNVLNGQEKIVATATFQGFLVEK